MNRDSSLRMYSNAYKLFLNFKMALYSSVLVMKHFKNKVVLSQNYYYEAEG